MTRVFITGASAGIGQALTESLIDSGYAVWGIARRQKSLLNFKNDLTHSQNFRYSSLDVTDAKGWRQLISKMRSQKFSPQVVIFNAAILEKDYLPDGTIDIASIRRMMETNYTSLLSGFNELRRIIKKNTQIVFIGSSSAFKGTGEEGIGYSGSKSALNSAFESLQQRLGKKYHFKIIHLGPVKTTMVPFNSKILFMRSPQQASQAIIRAINSPGHIFYYPWLLFIGLRLIKILPASLYLSALNLINNLHKKHLK